jgi:glycine cleavage system H lipoate-binding protein
MSNSDIDLPLGFSVNESGQEFTLKVSLSVKDLTGDFIEFKIPEEGFIIDKEASLVTINGTEEDLELKLPFACIVTEVNTDLAENVHLSSEEDWVLKFERYKG